MYDVIVKRIKELRLERKMSHLDIAEQFVCSEKTISSFECGRNHISYEYIIKYAKLFNVTTDYLLGLSDERITPENICEYIGLSKEYIDKLHTVYSIRGEVDDIKNMINGQILVTECIDSAKIYGMNLRNIRKERGIAMSELAELTGVAITTLYSAERGQRRLKQNIIQIIADFFGIDIDWFMHYHQTI